MDFLPRVPILVRWVAEYIGHKYVEFASDYGVLVEDNLACSHAFSLDQLFAISDPVREAHGFGGEVVFIENRPPYCPHPPLEKNRDLSLSQKPDLEMDNKSCSGIYHDTMSMIPFWPDAIIGVILICKSLLLDS